MLRAYEAQLWLLQDNVPLAIDCAENGLSDPSREHFRFDMDFFVVGHEQMPILPIQVLMAQGRAAGGSAAFHRALTLLQHEAARSDERGLRWLQIKTRVLQALAYHALGETECARGSLQHALILGQSEGYVRVFANEGAPLAALLREDAVGDTMREYLPIVVSATHAVQEARGLP
jgi:LuxR family maltose regulon positive regulatory protein